MVRQKVGSGVHDDDSDDMLAAQEFGKPAADEAGTHRTSAVTDEIGLCERLPEQVTMVRQKVGVMPPDVRLALFREFNIAAEPWARE